MRLSTLVSPAAFRFAAGLSLLVSALAFAAPGDLYVTSDASNKVRRYDGSSGSFLSVFSISGSSTGQMAIHFGATNNRVLIGHNAFGVGRCCSGSGGGLM